MSRGPITLFTVINEQFRRPTSLFFHMDDKAALVTDALEKVGLRHYCKDQAPACLHMILIHLPMHATAKPFATEKHEHCHPRKLLLRSGLFYVSFFSLTGGVKEGHRCNP